MRARPRRFRKILAASGRKCAAWPTLFLLVLLPGAGCKDPPPKTPEDAFDLVVKACDKSDPARLFDALDLPTQWSIETVHAAQREMRELIQSTYPPDEQARVLGRIPAAASEELDHPWRYYRRLDGSAGELDALCKRLRAGQGRPVGTVDHRAQTATVWRAGGSVFHFARTQEGRWGYSELRDLWEHAKLRATHDLETVRKNAALYRQLAGPSAAGGATGPRPKE